jgi:hypothetical protein
LARAPKGAERTDDTHSAERVGGVLLVIKDGIVYDAEQLLSEVADIVARAKEMLE